MIGYLKGKIIQVSKNLSNRIIAVIEVNNIGYEVQITPRFSRQLKTATETDIKIFTHLQIQEDRQVLYGFPSAAERDLFRQLVSVSGIGMQLAIALIDTLGISDLVGAIITSNIPALTKTPGVGKKTAERISLELKNKLSKWKEIADISVDIPESKTSLASPELLEDLEMTLLALGYTEEEIEDAIAAISQDQQIVKNPNVEEWIRGAIAWLSGE
ncbi:MAG: Holliday junction branch migration protein RuvA [Xenococcaceae cyanobacterium MO_207.B15]|nr:Holliday junction branch migration protein RuvA [Xenococcaceae cyanobacterium MO_207.B15]